MLVLGCCGWCKGIYKSEVAEQHPDTNTHSKKHRKQKTSARYRAVPTLPEQCILCCTCTLDVVVLQQHPAKSSDHSKQTGTGNYKHM